MRAQYLAAEHLGEEIAFTSRSGHKARGFIEQLVHEKDSVRIKLNTERTSLYLCHDTVVAGAFTSEQEVTSAGQLNGTHLGKVLVFTNGTQRIHALLEHMEVSGRERNSKNILLVYKTRGREGYRRLGLTKPLVVRAPAPEDLLNSIQWRARNAAEKPLVTA